MMVNELYDFRLLKLLSLMLRWPEHGRGLLSKGVNLGEITANSMLHVNMLGESNIMLMIGTTLPSLNELEHEHILTTQLAPQLRL